MRMKLQRKVRGSVTIEASFLLPLILFLMWNLLFLAFYLHDQALSTEAAYMTALRTERIIGKEDAKREVAEKKLEQDLLQRVAASDVFVEKELSPKEIRIKTEVTMRAPAALFFQSRWSGVQHQRAESFWPVDFIRNCRRVESLGRYVKNKMGE